MKLRSGALRLVAGACAFALLASGCSKKSGDAIPTPPPGAKQGGVLRVGITQPQTIDPAAVDVGDPAGTLVVQTMCDTMFTYDPATALLKPSVAESFQIGDGGRRLTIKLRKDVKFHNGKEMVAEDVVYALSRIGQRDFASPVASLVEPIAGYQTVHGNQETDDERYRKLLSGARVIENYSFEVNLEGGQRLSDFYRVLGHPATSPFPKADVEARPETFGRQPICTGPYKLTAPWAPGQDTISLERFTDYYAANTAFTSGGRGYADNIEFKIFASRADALAAYQTGQVDVAAVPPEVLDNAASLGENLVAAQTPTLEYVGLPTSTEPFNQRDVRLALSLALDRKSLVDQVYNGLRTPASGLYPASLGDVSRPDACEKLAPVNGDLAKAKETLTASGVDLNNKSIKLYYADEFGHREFMEAVAAQWKAAFGLEAELIGMNWDQYLEKGLRQPGFDGPFRMSWSAQYPSPDRYIQPLFDSTSIGQNNFTRYSSRGFDRALEKDARRAGNEADIRIEYQTLENKICGEMPLIPIDFGVRPWAVNKSTLSSAASTFATLDTAVPVLREFYFKG